MVIQCESCQTEFNLNESLLKKEGTKVRCSRCRHVFRVYPPSQDLEGPAPAVEEPVDDIISKPEEDLPQPEEKGTEAELDSDLDLIYSDVFSVDDRDGLDEKREAGDAVDDLFEKASRGEEELVETPPPVFPAMDAPDSGRETPGKKEKRQKEPRKGAPKEKTPRKRSKRSSMTVLIPILFIVLGVAAAYYVWKSDLIPPSILSLLTPSPKTKEPADAGARLLQFGSVNGAFVDTENSGPLFVIRGMVTNKYPQNRRYIKIKGSILNNKGVVVLSKTAYAGNTFSEEELKTLPIDEILGAAGNRDGMAKQNLNVASGATIPFMVVFNELPDDLSEFTVEAVSSSPGN